MVQVVEPLITLLFQHFLMATLPAIMHVATLLPVPYGIYLSTAASGVSNPTPIVNANNMMAVAMLTAFISVATISARNVFFKGANKASLVSAPLPTTIWDSSVAYWRIAMVASVILLPGYLYTLTYLPSYVFSSNVSSDKCWLLIRGVVLHVVYNTFSFITLAKMEPVTHSLLNVIKRILTVTISMIYFNIAWIPLQVMGIIIANVGVV